MPREIDDRLRRIENIAYTYRMNKKINPTFLLFLYPELLQSVRYLTRTPISNLNPSTVEVAKKGIQSVSISLYAHLDNGKFSTGFHRMSNDLLELDVFQVKDLLIHEKALFDYLGMPDYLQYELIVNAEEMREKFRDRYVKATSYFSFKEVLGPLVEKATLANDPIVERSPFNWSRAIVAGLGTLSLTVNGILWSSGTAVSAISFTFGILLTAYAAGRD